jgi:tetratricopeptide (TPR) repeat protein
MSNCSYQADEAHALIRKSQIAIEYAYRVRDSAPQTWVFWIHASNATRFKQAYTDIAARIELPGRDDPKADILRLLHNWLCDERNGQWLIILDNADDDQVLHSTGVDSDGVAHGTEAAHETAPLASFLPQSSNGWILVTSRDLGAALNLVGTKSVFRVEPMVEEEALMLLKTRIPVGKTFEDDSKILVKRLGYIPLAITHAASYMEVRDQTVTTYLELFRESEENKAHLLSNQEIRDIRRDSSGSSAVITTWHISFEQIQKTKPEAAELLSLMAMFDRQGIPESILYDGRDKLQFEDAVAPLTSFSLIKAQSAKQPEQQFGGRLFEMHDLVQLATKKWLEVQMQIGTWQNISLRIMATSFPAGQLETWATCQVLLPHARKMLSYIIEDSMAALDQAVVADSVALYLLERGEYAVAEKIARTALMGKERVLGEEHRDTIHSVHQLGLMLEGQGKYKEAEAMYRRALKGPEMAVGEDLNMLISMSRLGLVLARQFRYKEAEAMSRRALKGFQKVLGEEHRHTLTSVSNLGLVLETQGKYEEAEAMQRRALERLEKIVGKEHLDAFTGAVELGSVLQTQGKYKEADELHRRAIEGYKKTLGEEHPVTISCIANLSLSLHCQGQWKKAEDLEIQAMEASERVLGREHPDTIKIMNNLAVTLKCQGRNREAISLMETCFQLRAKVLGSHHPDTESSLRWLNWWRKGDI